MLLTSRTVKKGTDGKVTALWPGSSLHYMQCLAEDRWEDYEWRYERQRYSYWGKGFSWIERPGLDPLGLEAREYGRTMSTIADRESDLSFYLTKSEPLPKDVMPYLNDLVESRPKSGELDSSEMGKGSDSGLDIPWDESSSECVEAQVKYDVSDTSHIPGAEDQTLVVPV